MDYSLFTIEQLAAGYRREMEHFKHHADKGDLQTAAFVHGKAEAIRTELRARGEMRNVTPIREALR